MTQANKQRTFWGHSLSDYVQMFNLTDDELNKNILDVRGGPSSFNAEMTANGKNVTSCDEMYHLPEQEINKQVRSNLANPDMLEKDFQDFKNQQTKNIETFLSDYSKGKKENRYIAAELTKLPFKTHEFDLALLHHGLFNNHSLTPQEITQILNELSRVTHEVRVFPLLDNEGKNSPLLGPVMMMLQQQEFGVEVKHVDFEIQSYSNAMLRVWPLVCEMD